MEEAGLHCGGGDSTSVSGELNLGGQVNIRVEMWHTHLDSQVWNLENSKLEIYIWGTLANRY